MKNAQLLLWRSRTGIAQSMVTAFLVFPCYCSTLSESQWPSEQWWALAHHHHHRRHHFGAPLLLAVNFDSLEIVAVAAVAVAVVVVVTIILSHLTRHLHEVYCSTAH